MTAKLPTYEKSEDEIKFETYRFYLKCIIGYLHSEYDDWISFGQRVIESTNRLNKLADCDQRYLDRFLKIAWNTEYLACNSSFSDVDTVKINNQWKPIQIYYAIYSAGEALSYLIDRDKADSHKKCLRKLSDFWHKQQISPWSFAFKGSRGRSRCDHSPVGFPQGLSVPHNLARRGIEPIEMIAKCLKAEHLHRIDEDFRKERGRFKYKFDPGHTTILHFFYRLRIKSNYKDAEIFLADAPESDVMEFSKNLSEFCFWTMLLFEIYIIRRCGFSCLDRLIGQYNSKNDKAKQLQERVSFYEEHFKRDGDVKKE